MEKTIEEIRQLMIYFKEIGLGEIEIDQKDFHLRLTSENHVPAYAPMPATSNPIATKQLDSDVVPTQTNQKGTLLNAPVVGTIYTAPSPSDPDFVRVGDTVTKGQIVFLVESMKLLNDVVCPCDGEVAEILVSNADTVEYGQPLMRIV